MAQSFVQLSPDSTGKKMDTSITTTAAQHRQVMSIGDKATDANIAPVDATKGLAVDLTNTGQNTTKLLVTPDSVALPANQSVNVSQLNGTTTDTNSGNKSAGTLRVVLATDQPALTNKLLVTPDSVALPANQSVNVNQIAGTATSVNNGTTDAGTIRATIASNSTGSLVPTADVSVSGTLGSLNAVYQPTVLGYNCISFVASGTWVGTITPSVSSDGSTYVAAHVYSVDNMTSQPTFTTNGTFIMFFTGAMNKVQLKMTSYTSGTATITANKSMSPNVNRVTEGMPGNTAPAMGMAVGGTDGTNYRMLLTDSSGRAAVNVNGTVAVTESGTWTVQPGNTANTTPWLVAGAAAQGATVSGNPVYAGAQGRTTLQTQVASGQAVGVVADRAGRLYQVSPVCSNASSAGTAITTNTNTQIIAAPSAGNHLRIHRLLAQNSSATGTWCYWGNGSGVKTLPFYLAQYQVVSLAEDGRWELSSATALYMNTATTGANIEWFVEYETLTD